MLKLIIHKVGSFEKFEDDNGTFLFKTQNLIAQQVKRKYYDGSS